VVVVMVVVVVVVVVVVKNWNRKLQINVIVTGAVTTYMYATRVIDTESFSRITGSDICPLVKPKLSELRNVRRICARRDASAETLLRVNNCEQDVVVDECRVASTTHTF